MNSQKSFIVPYLKKTYFGLHSRRNALLNLIFLVFCLLLALRALTHLDTSWDSLAYHLPFAARLSGIYPSSVYLYNNYFETLYAGVPTLAEWLQGWFWRVTGLVSATNLIGLISLLVVIFESYRKLRIKIWMLALFFFSIPLVSIHSVSSYNDLPGNACIALAFIYFIAAHERNQYDFRSLISTLIPLIISANMKYQSLLVGSIFFVFFIVVFLFENRSTVLVSRVFALRVIVALLICSFAFGSKLLANVVRYDNPFYPLEVKIGPVNFKGPLGVGLAGESKDIAPFERYLVSLSEIKLWTDNRGELWTIDMWTSGNSSDSLNFKTGGYFVANLVLWAVTLSIIYVETIDKKLLFYMIIVFGSFLLVGIMPGGPYYLRYWMFLPLNLAVLLLVFINKYDFAYKTAIRMVVILQLFIFSFVTYQVSDSVLPSSLAPRDILHSLQVLHTMPDKVENQVQEVIGHCIVFQDTRQGFLYKLSHTEESFRAVTNESECSAEEMIIYYP